jgi:hypothetical protein
LVAVTTVVPTPGPAYVGGGKILGEKFSAGLLGPGDSPTVQASGQHKAGTRAPHVTSGTLTTLASELAARRIQVQCVA